MKFQNTKSKNVHRRKYLYRVVVIYIWIFIRHQPMTAKTDETEERSDT